MMTKYLSLIDLERPIDLVHGLTMIEANTAFAKLGALEKLKLYVHFAIPSPRNNGNAANASLKRDNQAEGVSWRPVISQVSRKAQRAIFGVVEAFST